MGLVRGADGRAGLVTVPVRTATGSVISLPAAIRHATTQEVAT